MENKIFKLIRLASCVAHLVGLGLLILGRPPFLLLLIMPASLLLFLAADNQVRQSNSLLLGNYGRAVQLLIVSLIFGAFLESANFYFQHRYFGGLPAETVLRWGFFIILFSLQLPLLLELERFLDNIGLAEIMNWRKISFTSGVYRMFLGLAGLLLVAAAVRPDSLYPFFWISILLLTDSIVNLSGHSEMSVSGQFEEGYYGQAFRLVLAGTVTGFLWEFWNYWSPVKWFYSPSAGTGDYLFELPALEYWSYACIALAAYGFYQLSQVMKDKTNLGFWPFYGKAVACLLLVLFLAAVLAGIDQVTVASFRRLI